jgi:Mor family transcriptional regulator
MVDENQVDLTEVVGITVCSILKKEFGGQTFYVARRNTLTTDRLSAHIGEDALMLIRAAGVRWVYVPSKDVPIIGRTSREPRTSKEGRAERNRAMHSEWQSGVSVAKVAKKRNLNYGWVLRILNQQIVEQAWRNGKKK